RAMRVIRGFVGQSLDEMETRHYIIETTSGPGVDGRFTITGKDTLKMLDDDRAQAPALSGGYLASGISAGDSSATLAPTGIGDEEYPASGTVAIGNEICSFTRSGDTLSLTR